MQKRNTFYLECLCYGYLVREEQVGKEEATQRARAGATAGSIKRCGAAKGDATWVGAQETHRWAWRLSLRGAPGRRDMKLYTGFAVEGIFLFLSPPIASLAYATIFRLQSRLAAVAAYATAVRINKKSSFFLSFSFKSARFFRHELRSTRQTPPSHLGGGQSAS